MSLENIVICLIESIFQALAVSVIVFKQLPKDCHNKKEKIKFFSLMCIYCIISFFFIPNQFRFILSMTIISLLVMYIFNLRNSKIILYSFNTHINMSICEIVITLLLVIVGINSKDIVTIPKYNLLANVLIGVSSIILINIPIINKSLSKVVNLFSNNRKLLRYFYAFMAILYLITLKNGFELLLTANYYINILFMIVVVTIITIIIKNELKYNQIEEENKQMLNYVTKYEKIITEQGKANHEFKNQLMVIRGYAQMNSPKLIEYIDSLTQDANKTHSSFIISQLNKFPDGGIKGLLYYKLSVIEDYKLNYQINVAKGVKTSLNNLNTTFYKNITKVLGVILDNAIDASYKSKDKKIIIDVFKEKGFVNFNIINTYKGKVDMSIIGTGFSSKGSGHGYGLKLVRDIIDGDSSIVLENYLEDSCYVTKLKLKVPKKIKQIKNTK